MAITVGTRVTDLRSYPPNRTAVVREEAKWGRATHYRVEYVDEEGLPFGVAAPAYRWAVESELVELAALVYEVNDTVTIAGESGTITDIKDGIATVEQSFDVELDGGGFLARNRTFTVPTWELELIDI